MSALVTSDEPTDSKWRWSLRRLPITVRLTLAFAAVMVVVFAGTGLFLYLRLEAELDRTVEEGLRSRADDVAAFVHRSGPASSTSGVGRLTDAEESFAQIVDARGRVQGGSRGMRYRSLLTASERDQAMTETLMVDRRTVPSLDEDPLRLLATPVPGRDGTLLVIVGASLGDHDEALSDLANHLLMGVPIALLLAILTAFGVARAALRPVESMRRRASMISGADPSQRLPVAPTGDELSRLGETLNAMLARLEGAIVHERTFVSDAGHELRTPLTILKMELELALRHGGSAEELRETIQSSAGETERLVRLAEDLLVISGSEHRQLQLDPAWHEVGDILETVVQRFGRAADERGCALEVDAPADLHAFADRFRLEQALGNLVDNAMRHGAHAVSLTAEQRDRAVELHALDDGPGFPAEFLERAFERFSRPDAGRTEGGTGLGLAVVEGIAVAHGGVARAANRPTGGADVWLSLPAEAPTPTLDDLLAPRSTTSRLGAVARRRSRRRRQPAGRDRSAPAVPDRGAGRS